MDILPILLVIFAIVKAVTANKKKKQTQQARRGAAEEAFGRGFAPGTAAKPKPAQPSVKPTAPAKPKVAQPRVHAHLAPACDTHDKPGSLGVTSSEGWDACHEGDLPPMDQPRAAFHTGSEEQSGIALDWSGENLVKAFVMQEVLTRPCQRRRA